MRTISINLKESTTGVLLAVSAFEEDHTSLEYILRGSGWKLRGVRTCREAQAFLRLHPVSVVICEGELPDGDWRAVLNETARRPAALIVASRHADEDLWLEVLTLGGYDVLIKPFDAEEVLRVVGLASLRASDSLALR